MKTSPPFAASASAPVSSSASRGSSSRVTAGFSLASGCRFLAIGSSPFFVTRIRSGVFYKSRVVSGVVSGVVRTKEKWAPGEKIRAFDPKRGDAVAVRGTEGHASPLLIRLFGPLEVWRDGEPLPPLRTRSGLWLL